MNSNNLIAKSSIKVDASVSKCWDALVDPEAIKQYMFGTNVVTDWKEGSPIVWKGEWKGKTYEDKGVILACKPMQTISYSHFSPLTGLPDKPENYHIVTIDLTTEGNQTCVSLSQDNNTSEQDRDHSKQNWDSMLEVFKKYVEQSSSK